MCVPKSVWFGEKRYFFVSTPMKLRNVRALEPFLPNTIGSVYVYRCAVYVYVNERTAITDVDGPYYLPGLRAYGWNPKVKLKRITPISP
jgi:hypothetical protein